MYQDSRIYVTFSTRPGRNYPTFFKNSGNGGVKGAKNISSGSTNNKLGNVTVASSTVV